MSHREKNERAPPGDHQPGQKINFWPCANGQTRPLRPAELALEAK